MIPSRLTENPKITRNQASFTRSSLSRKAWADEEENDEVGAKSKQFDAREKRIRSPMQRELQQADGDESEKGPVQRVPLNRLFPDPGKQERPRQ